MGFVKPRYGSDFSSYVKEFKVSQPDIKKGETSTTIEFRIIPPIKSLETSGKWAIYEALHYGYNGVHPKDPEKKVPHPFVCLEQKDFRTQMITHVCPECDQIRLRKESLNNAINKAKSMGKKDDDIKKLSSPFSEWLRLHNRDGKWRLNVKLPNNEFGVLKISHSTKKLLDVEINKIMNERKLDPIDAEQGVWFRITRVATGDRSSEVRDTVSVVMVQKTVQVEGQMMTVEVLKEAKLTESDFDTALVKCADLPIHNPRISDEQIALLVKCSGDPEEVDKIFGISHDIKEASAEPVEDNLPPNFGMAEPKVETMPITITVPENPKIASVTVPESPKQIEMGGVVFETPPKVEKVVEKVPEMPLNADTMSDADFLRLMLPNG